MPFETARIASFITVTQPIVDLMTAMMALHATQRVASSLNEIGYRARQSPMKTLVTIIDAYTLFNLLIFAEEHLVEDGLLGESAEEVDEPMDEIGRASCRERV